jgi:linoleoyl-CoA desaturase
MEQATNSQPLDATPDFFNDLRVAVKEYFEKQQVSKYGNWNLTAKSALMGSLYFVPYFLMIFGLVHSPFVMLLCWVVMGIGMAGVAMSFMHDANHGSVSSNQTLNAVLSKSIFLLGGFPANWKYQHNVLHHGYTNIEGHDDDIEPVGILRFSPHKPLRKIHKLQYLYAWFFYGLLTLSWVTIKDFNQFVKYRRQNGYITKHTTAQQLLTWLVLNKVAYYIIFVVLPLIFIPIAWYWIVLSFLAMHFLASLILSTVFQTAHVVPTSQFPVGDADGNVENHWAVHQLLNTTNFSPRSSVFSWLIGGLNYQVEHHLFPTISHVHYKKISSLVKQTAQKHQLPYYVQDNFFVAIRSHIKMLKMLGRPQTA